MSEQIPTGAVSAIPSYPFQSVLVATVLGAALVVGTGGFATEQMLKNDRTNLVSRDFRGSAANGNIDAVHHDPTSLRACVAAIRSNFDFSMVDLAAVMLVSRPTIYEWMAERQAPQPSNLTRLIRLHALSSVWRLLIGANVDTVTRKFTDKTDLVSLLSSAELDVSEVTDRLGLIATARTAVPAQLRSIRDIMKDHGIRSVGKARQDEAIASAGR